MNSERQERRMVWDTVSKSAERSSRARMVTRPLSAAIFMRAVSVL